VLIEVGRSIEAPLAHLAEPPGREVHALKVLAFVFGYTGIVESADVRVVAEAAVHERGATSVQPPDEHKALA
jgi:hypothetical protein